MQNHNRIPIMHGVIPFLILFLAVIVQQASAQFPGAEKAPEAVVRSMASGSLQEIIVLFDDRAVQSRADAERSARRLATEDDQILSRKASAYRSLKNEVLATLSGAEIEVLRDYSHLPMAFMRVRTMNGLQGLLHNPKVVAVYENEQFYPVLTQSLPLINQPQTAAGSPTKRGENAAVAVLDSGLDYTRSAFGSCTGGSIPGDCLSAPPPIAGCRVPCVHDFAPGDGLLDDFSVNIGGHGTNVSGIVAGVAPEARILGLDVFDGDTASSIDIIAAIDWCIANRSGAFYGYNIVAMNMSFGNGILNQAPCSNNVFSNPITNARSAGIISSIASGNEGYINGLSSPACVPSGVSVGAVKDGEPFWAEPADSVASFSNSASFLTILAPGQYIVAAGIEMAGTSQAAPHIAGAIAVLKGTNAFPSDTPDQTIGRMTGTGTQIFDARNGVTKPRINLLAASTPPGFSLSGTITKPAARGGTEPFPNVTVNLSGAGSGTATTNALGQYTFNGLSNGSYTVTPSAGGFSFIPADRNVNINNANSTGVDFSGDVAPQTFSLSGTVTSGGSPLANVTMNLTGAANAQTTTNAQGQYAFSSLANGSYTVTPSLAGFTFSPPSANVTVNNANVTQNFTATAVPQTFSVSGTVTSGGSPLANVTMNLTGAANAQTTTNAQGQYTFSSLSNGSYTVTPSLNGFTFTPPSANVTVSNANVTQNFTATAVPQTFSVSGTVTSGGSPLANVTMNLTGAANAQTTTNAQGQYIFSSLSNGSYTVTPSLNGFTFTPPSANVTVSNANVTQNFTATAAATYSINGTITVPGARGALMPLQGVAVSLSGAENATTTTNASGIYTFSGLANGSYTVTPSSPSYVFSPTSRNVTINNANVAGQNFSGTPGSTPPPPTYSISGTVTSGGSPLANITVSLSGTSGGSTVTNASGNYVFSGLSNGSYTVTPSGASYTFTPINRIVTINNANATGQDFAGTAIPVVYSISGTVTAITGRGMVSPVPGVTVTLGGAASAQATTNSSGNYTFSGLSSGGYSITPTQSGFSFTPAVRNATVSGANVTDQNFVRD